MIQNDNTSNNDLKSTMDKLRKCEAEKETMKKEFSMIVDLYEENLDKRTNHEKNQAEYIRELIDINKTTKQENIAKVSELENKIIELESEISTLKSIRQAYKKQDKKKIHIIKKTQENTIKDKVIFVLSFAIVLLIVFIFFRVID